MGFIIILILTTLSIAGSAAFFSVYGLAQIFTGSFWPVVIMASSLEVGKLVTASYLYRFWEKIGWAMRSYMLAAVFVLMGITSAGIFGFLSGAYQQDVLGIKINDQQVHLLTEEITQLEHLKTERLDRKKQIDADIAALPNSYVKGRQKLMSAYGSELEQLKTDIADYTKTIRENTAKIAELKSTNLEQEAHVGPIIFIAKVFGEDVDNTTKWLILIIIFAFDPLAIALTVGTNIAIVDRQTLTGKKLPKVFEAYEEAMGVDTEQFDEPEPDEPEPQVTSLDQLFSQPKENITTDQIRQVLDEFQHKELSPAERAQKSMLEEMLRRKDVTERIRNPNKNG